MCRLADFWGKDEQGQPMDFPGMYLIVTQEEYDNPCFRNYVLALWPDIQFIPCEPTCLH